MNKQALLNELQMLGFTRFEPLKKDMRDGKTRLLFLRPIKTYNEWFEARIVEENNELRIEKLSDPFLKTFETCDIQGLVEYIKETIHQYIETDAEC